MRLALVALALTAGCGVADPLNAEVDAPEGVDAAVAQIFNSWAGGPSGPGGWSGYIDGAENLSPEDLPVIRWFEGLPCPGSGDPVCLLYPDADDHTPAMAKWLWGPFGAEEIQVVRMPTIHETGLPHEILHWTLDGTTGDPDANHEAESWFYLPDVKNYLRAAGY